MNIDTGWKDYALKFRRMEWIQIDYVGYAQDERLRRYLGFGEGFCINRGIKSNASFISGRIMQVMCILIQVREI